MAMVVSPLEGKIEISYDGVVWVPIVDIKVREKENV